MNIRKINFCIVSTFFLFSFAFIGCKNNRDGESTQAIELNKDNKKSDDAAAKKDAVTSDEPIEKKVEPVVDIKDSKYKDLYYMRLDWSEGSPTGEYMYESIDAYIDEFVGKDNEDYHNGSVDKEDLKKRMCAKVNNLSEEKNFFKCFCENYDITYLSEDTNTKVILGENAFENIFIFSINEDEKEYPKYIYAYKYSPDKALKVAKYDSSKKSDEVFDAIYSLDGRKWDCCEYIKPLLDYQEKEYVKNDKGEIIQVKYSMDYNEYGTFNSSGVVFYDKKGRPLYRDYYVTSGGKYIYYLYNENDELIQCFDFGGMSYGGLDEKGDIEIGGKFETYIFKR